jgi:hypothetical protein
MVSFAQKQHFIIKQILQNRLKKLMPGSCAANIFVYGKPG